MRLDDASQLAESLASPAAEPAAGVALCTTGAMAAGLIAKACALSPDAGLEAELARATDLRIELLATAERDVAAFYAVLDTRRNGGDEHEAWVVAAPGAARCRRAARGDALPGRGRRKRCRPALRGEPVAAALIAAGAERAALALAEMDEGE